MKWTRSLLATLMFAAASTLNPAYIAGCGVGDDEPHFEYGAEELVALLEHANGSVELEASSVMHCPGHVRCTASEVPYRVELELTPKTDAEATARFANWLGMRANACGNRELFASASACYDSAFMSVHGSVKITRLEADIETVVADVDVEGRVEVHGLKLSNAYVDLRFDGGALTFGLIEGPHGHQLTFRP